MYVPEPKQYWFEEDLHAPIFFGAAHSVSSDPQQDVVIQLREVVAEITGKPVDRKIGFY